MTTSAYSSPQYFLHDGSALIGYQQGIQSQSLLTPPGGGLPASDVYINQGQQGIQTEVPLYDAFGSTIEIVLLGNPQIVANYSYDPYGVMKVNSGYRSPFPFVYHGLEQEYYDSQKLYWEPNGNVYNPDPFQLSPSGPQGLGGGGAFPRAIRGPGSNPQVNLGADIYDVVINTINAFGGVNFGGSEGSNFPLDPFLNPFDWFSGGKPTIPWYDTTHTSRGAHDIYPVMGIRNIVDQSPSASGGGGGRPLARGDAPSPSQYEQWGRTASSIQNLWNLAQFHRGGNLDAQKYGASPAYANYVFGVYMAAHGYTLPETLDGAEKYAFNFSRYPSKTPMSPAYPSMPAANVANITKGFNDERNGTLGLP